MNSVNKQLITVWTINHSHYSIRVINHHRSHKYFTYNVAVFTDNAVNYGSVVKLASEVSFLKIKLRNDSVLIQFAHKDKSYLGFLIEHIIEEICKISSGSIINNQYDSNYTAIQL